MSDDETVLSSAPLFRGLSGMEREEVLRDLHARRQTYTAGVILLLAGTEPAAMGMVLDGRIQVVREDEAGNRTILTELEPGELFGEAFLFAQGTQRRLPVTVLAVTDCRVLWIDRQRMRGGAHPLLTDNLLAILAGKNRLLNRRIGHLSRRTTREKLLSYLTEQADWQGSRSFSIPLSRQELADYLCVERSAMSAALGRLREEGILDFQRSHFTLYSPVRKKKPEDEGPPAR
ncbi:MAG: Crp/Fnr family transcriptional regulator [Clostridiales bacterium]|nr:Crp/Fnr family transcriptional regulator [Clostridiales bacterium]